jgi:hypothetical protein
MEREDEERGVNFEFMTAERRGDSASRAAGGVVAWKRDNRPLRTIAGLTSSNELKLSLFPAGAYVNRLRRNFLKYV